MGNALFYNAGIGSRYFFAWPQDISIHNPDDPPEPPLGTFHRFFWHGKEDQIYLQPTQEAILFPDLRTFYPA
jgi:hypothetical protein